MSRSRLYARAALGLSLSRPISNVTLGARGSTVSRTVVLLESAKLRAERGRLRKLPDKLAAALDKGAPLNLQSNLVPKWRNW